VWAGRLVRAGWCVNCIDEGERGCGACAVVLQVGWRVCVSWGSLWMRLRLCSHSEHNHSRVSGTGAGCGVRAQVRYRAVTRLIEEGRSVTRRAGRARSACDRPRMAWEIAAASRPRAAAGPPPPPRPPSMTQSAPPRGAGWPAPRGRVPLRCRSPRPRAVRGGRRRRGPSPFDDAVQAGAPMAVGAARSPAANARGAPSTTAPLAHCCG